MSFGERPVHSVATICWFSPMSGMASTAMGFRGKALCHSKGENDIPQPMKAKRNKQASIGLSRKYFTALLNIKRWNVLEVPKKKLLIDSTASAHLGQSDTENTKPLRTKQRRFAARRKDSRTGSERKQLKY